MSKLDQATKLFQTVTAEAEAEGKQLSRKEIIAIFIEKLGMTESGASTYHYTVTKNLKNKTSLPEKGEKTAKPSKGTFGPIPEGTQLKRNQRVRAPDGEVLQVDEAKGEYVWCTGKAGWFHITTLELQA